MKIPGFSGGKSLPGLGRSKAVPGVTTGNKNVFKSAKTKSPFKGSGQLKNLTKKPKYL